MQSKEKRTYKKREDLDYVPSSTIINIKRICLRCDKQFKADSKFIRLCYPCKNTLEWESGFIVYNTYK